MKKSHLKNIFIFFVFEIFIFLNNLIAQNIALDWVHSLEGTIAQSNTVFSKDAGGNIYTIGNFPGMVDCDPSSNEFNLICDDTSFLQSDFFVSKFNNEGDFLWAKQIQGIENEAVETITTDELNNVYLLGSFYGVVDFDMGNQVFELSASGVQNTFILKLDENGNFIWVKNIVASNLYLQKSIAIDHDENVIVAGNFKDTVDLDPSENIFELISTGENDIFILKLNEAGEFIWANKMGGLENDELKSIAVDNSNNIYSTGGFSGTADFNPKYGIYNLTAFNGSDIFVSKLDANGNFNWAKSMGGIQGDLANSITIDTFQNVIATGRFSGTIDFDPGESSFNLTGNSGAFSNMFILKLDQEGDFVWAKKIDAKISTDKTPVTTDNLGNIYTTGSFRETGDFDPSESTYNLAASGPGEIFISKLDASGNFLYAYQFGFDQSSSFGKSILLDNENNLFIYGRYSGTIDFNPNEEVLNLTSTENSNTFLLKLTQPDATNLQEKQSTFSINIYPNPSNGNITVYLKENAEISIFNILGETVLQQNFGAGDQNINLQEETNGIYFVKVISEKGIATGKIIKSTKY